MSRVSALTGKYTQRTYAVPYGNPTKRVAYVEPTVSAFGNPDEIMRQKYGVKITLLKADIWERLFAIGNEMRLSCNKK